MDFQIHQTYFLSSDHALITLEIMSRGLDMNQLCQRGRRLGKHWPWGTREPDEVALRKSVNDIDNDLLLSKLSEVNIRCDEPVDVHTCTSKISESLYISVVSSSVEPA